MTEKEKAKAYDEAIERAKKLYGNGITEEIFPELKESDDDRIKKDLIQWVDEFPDIIWRGHYKEDIIAWLEKQGDNDKLIQELGEYKVKYTQEVLEKYITSMSNKDNERLRKTTIAFLKDFAEKGYENAVECIDWLEKQGEQSSSQTNEHAWTIQDAKDGDVLALSWLEDKNLWEKIIIFKKYHSKGVKGLSSMPCVEGYGNTFMNGKMVFAEKAPYYSKTWTCNLHPATKEQRDTLMKAMNDDGYEWDAEKKELKKEKVK